MRGYDNKSIIVMETYNKSVYFKVRFLHNSQIKFFIKGIAMARIFFLLFAGLTACTQAHNPIALSNDLNWIDLGHSFDRSTLYWPNNIKLLTKFLQM